MKSTDIRLKISHLQKSYEKQSALNDLSLEITSGEIFGLIGPDGAGKTTAMRIASGLLLPDSGTVTVMGYDVVKEPIRVKEHIGYMPQRFSLYPDLTVTENMRFFADLYGVPKAERAAREERLMKFSRLDSFRKRRAAQLSGGMKQKLALSCTLIHTPDVLILDEPTTGVDPLSRQEFWTILRELASDGQALLVSTPYMDEAMLCHRVALMHKGKALASGTPQDMAKLFHRKLFEVVGEGLNDALKIFTKTPIRGVSVARFGDRLHAVYDSADQERAIRDKLSALPVQIRPIEPTIEDTFVSLMGDGEIAS